MQRLGSPKLEGRLEGKSDRTYPTGPLETWSDPIPAILTGVRTALAVVVTWATWFVTAWPSGPTAAIVVAVVVMQPCGFDGTAGHD